MSETNKTFSLVIGAVVLALIAIVTTPRSVTPDEFVDRGEVFFPEFTDPNDARTLEVIEFDEESASAEPFQVTFKNGLWIIPSHHDYPADAEDRLAQTAAGIIGLIKEDFRTSNVGDHEACGVVDPLDEGATSLMGRGKRVTIKNQEGEILADLIFGKKVEDRPDYRFVRVPGQKRVYVTRTNIDISTNFADWIEQDLLLVDRDQIEQVILKDYSINERTRSVDRRDVIILNRNGDEWEANKMSSSQEVDTTKMSQLLRSIDELSIVGVRPKPAGLSEDLRRAEGAVPISQENVLSLQGRGFYFTYDGDLLSNEGELEVETDQGVNYKLRFGEILYGRGEAVSAGLDGEESEEEQPGENRYLFITVSFNPRVMPEPPQPSNLEFLQKEEAAWTEQDKINQERYEKHEEWRVATEEGQKKVSDLNERFADWYYVISAESFDEVRLERSDLIKAAD